jgi:hypothetical protein
MGDIAPSKMPTGKRKARRDDTDFTQYKEGGKVNAAGNYTKPSLRKRIVSQVKAAATHGTGAGQWSARKAQLVAKKYKAAGGGYRDWKRHSNPLKIGATRNGEPKVENRLAKQVSDTFQKLRLKVSALLSTLRQRVRNVLAKKPDNNS